MWCEIIRYNKKINIMEENNTKMSEIFDIDAVISKFTKLAEEVGVDKFHQLKRGLDELKFKKNADTVINIEDLASVTFPGVQPSNLVYAFIKNELTKELYEKMYQDALIKFSDGKTTYSGGIQEGYENFGKVRIIKFHADLSDVPLDKVVEEVKEKGFCHYKTANAMY